MLQDITAKAQKGRQEGKICKLLQIKRSLAKTEKRKRKMGGFLN